MNPTIKLAVSSLAIALAAAATSVTLNQAQAEGQSTSKERAIFMCGQSYDLKADKRLPTTFAWTSPLRKVAVVRWKTTQFGRNYNPEKRCELVAPRLQSAYDNDRLKFLTNGNIGNYPVICAVKNYGEKCQSSNLIMTLRPEEDSFAVLSDMIGIISGSIRGPITHSSGTRQAYYEIDFQKFLRTAPSVTD